MEFKENKLAKYLLPKDSEKVYGKYNIAYIVFSFVVAALALLSVGVVVRYIAGPMEGYLHADYTDTIYWANATYESGEILSSDFKYAAILPFSANLWFIPLIAVFGVGMKAQVLGMIIFLLLFAAAIYFVCRSFGWSISWTATAMTVTVLMLSGSEKLREIMWGHVIYYSLALLLFFVGLGLVKRISDAEIKLNFKSIALVCCAAILFAGTATDGFQIIALVTLPCLGALVAEYLCDKNNKLMSKASIKVIALAGLIVVSTGVGIVILGQIKGSITADYANTYSNIAPLNKWLDNLMDFPDKYLSLMGVTHTSAVPMGDIETIMMLVRMVASVVCLILPVLLLFNYKHIEEKGTRLLLWGHIIITAATMFGFVCGYLNGGASTNWRITTLAGSGVITSVAAVKFFIGRWRRPDGIVGARIMALLLAVLMLGSFVNLKTMSDMPMDYGRDNVLHRLTDELERNDLEYGYATFWRSQAITLLSDSEIKTRMVLADSERGVYTDYYQNSYSWYEDQDGVDRYFVLLSTGEDSEASRNAEWREFKKEHLAEKIEFESYVIYVFDKNLTFDK